MTSMRRLPCPEEPTVFAGSVNSDPGTRASLPTEHEARAPEQMAALGSYRARWAAIRRCTEPSDRGAAEERVRLASRAAGLKPPGRLVWCEGPVALSNLALRPSRADGPNVKPAVVDRLRRHGAAQVRGRIHARVQALVESMVNPTDGLVASAAETVIQAAAQENASLLDHVRRSQPLSLSVGLRVLLGQQGFRYNAAGQHDLSWLGAYDFFRNVLDLREETAPLLGLLQTAANLGWLQPHEHTCWLAERPDVLRGDPSDRLHSTRGPALRFP